MYVWFRSSRSPSTAFTSTISTNDNPLSSIFPEKIPPPPPSPLTARRPLRIARERAAVLRPFPGPIDVHALRPQHLLVRLGVVHRSIPENAPVRVRHLDPRVAGIALDH